MGSGFGGLGLWAHAARYCQGPDTTFQSGPMLRPLLLRFLLNPAALIMAISVATEPAHTSLSVKSSCIRSTKTSDRHEARSF